MPLLLLLLSGCCRADVLVLDSAIQGRMLGEYLQVWEDSDGNTTLKQLEQRALWQTVDSAVPNYGFVHHPFWFKLQLQAGLDSENWLLLVRNAMIEQLDVFIMANDRVLSVQHLGVNRSLNQRAIPHRLQLVPLVGLEQEQLTIYLRASTPRVLQLPIAIWQADAFMAQDELHNLIMGLFFGALSIMVLYNFFLYISIRDPIFLAYVGMVASALLLQACFKGVGYRYLWSHWFEWSHEFLLVGSFSVLFFSITVAEIFFSLRKRRPLFFSVVNVVRWACLASLPLTLLVSEQAGLMVATILALATSMIAIVAMVIFYHRDNRPLKLFIAGWGVMVVGVFLFLLSKMGVLPVNFWTEETMSLGILIELVFFSVALGDRINKERDQNLLAQSAVLNSLKAEREAKDRALKHEELERRARESSLRTQQENTHRLELEIERQTRDLEQAAKQLKQTIQMDPLTQVYNRRSFNDSLNREYARASRNQLHVALMMIDIDHFKQVNDQHGHVAGDDCLRFVAEQIRRCVEVELGEVYRFGGEEFVVMLPGATEDKAMELAEEVRELIASSNFQADGKELAVTVSIGVCALVPEPGSWFEQIVEQADSALYQAKQQGRNRVVAVASSGGVQHG